MGISDHRPIKGKGEVVLGLTEYHAMKTYEWVEV